MKILYTDKDPQILVITPLLTGHSISGETKTTLKRNKVPLVWASYMSDGKHAFNVQHGLQSYRKYTSGKVPPYLFVLDRDIVMGRHMLDRMLKLLHTTPKTVGWCYVPFEYSGHINVRFPSQPFDVNRLLHGNYISSNSLYKMEMIDRVGGFVTEEEVHRLSDWAMWLKCIRFGYSGILCPDTSFVAISTPNDISSGSNEEYQQTHRRVVEQFVTPLLRR